MKISLLGYMGSGKSTIGKELAEQLNIDFLDLDKFIESQHQKSINELFSFEGEIKFRKYERTALMQILEMDKSFVLSLGGGTPVYYDNMNLINQSTHSVYLRMSPKELIERLRPERSFRPMIAHLSDHSFPEFVAKHLFERRNYYEMADFTVSVKEKMVKEIVSEIIQNLPPHHPK